MRPHDAAPLSVRLFGAFEVSLGGQPLPPLKLRKSRALLALLVLRRGGEVERDWLAGLLWPESAQSPALHNLRNCLTDLRQALGPEAGRLRSPTSHTLALDLTEAAVDVLAFDAAIARGDPAALEEAVSLYRGPLLEGCVEEWAFQERQAREQAVLVTLERLAGEALAGGDAATAEGHLRRAAAVDPLRESARRHLMQALAAGGSYAAALLVYRELRLRLHRELNAQPDPETQALFQRLRADAREKASARRLARSTPPPSRGAAGAGNDGNGRTSSTAQELAFGEEVHGGETGPVAGARPFPRAGGEESSLVGVGRPEVLPKAVAYSHNLPPQWTRFFGREAEIARLCEAIGCQPSAVSRNMAAFTDGRRLTADSPRLVTLTGPGGTGKTRLALQVAQRLRSVLPGGVWFVSLRDLAHPALIPDQILLALRLPRSPQSEALEQVVAFLSRAPALLVLDNYEHLVEGGAQIVPQLLEQVEHLTALVTSRQCLGLEGEREFPVAPLPVPRVRGQSSGVGGAEALGLTPHPCSLTLVPSVALFLDRAQAVQPDFQLTPGNAAAVAALCARLEGLPLAIELAAARVRVLTPQQMLERLRVPAERAGTHEVGGRFELLVGRQRSGNPRHRSLRAALDWSYQLLSPELQRSFARLSIFCGGWTLGAAAAVLDFGFPISGCGGSGGAGAIENPDTQTAPKTQNALGCLEELQRCSLVVTEAVGEEMRYRLLETLREYGAEQLSAEERDTLPQRHLDYYVARFDCEKELPGRAGRTIQQRLDEVEREQDNVRAALDWWVQSGAALDWVLKTKDARGGLIELLARFWWVRGYAREGRQRLAEILALPGAAVPTPARAFLLESAGGLAQQQGDYGAADALVQERLAIYQELGDKQGELGCGSSLAALARSQGDYARAHSLHEQVLAGAREAGDEREIASALDRMGYTTYLEGDLAAAQSLLEESLQILRRGQEIAWARTYQGAAVYHSSGYREAVVHLGALAWACAHRGEVADARGDYPAARALLEESLTLSRDLGSPGWASSALRGLGRVAQHQGEWSAAAAHFGESLAFWRQDGNQQGIAACLEGLGAVASGQGEPERAARLLGAAAALRESRSIPLPPIERTDLDRVIAGVRSALGEAAFAAAWADGQALPLEQAIAEALQVPVVQS